MAIYRRCPACQRLNAINEVICTNCSADLAYADEVYAESHKDLRREEPPADVDTGGQPTGRMVGRARRDHEESLLPAGVCECVSAPEDPKRPGYCHRCGLPKSQVCGDRARPVTTDIANQRAFEPLLIWPPGVQCAVGTGVLIGRAVNSGPAALSNAMRRHPTLSRVHAWMGYEAGRLTIVDLESHNGTTVGAHRLVAGQSYVICLADEPVTTLAVEFGPSIRAQLKWEAKS